MDSTPEYILEESGISHFGSDAWTFHFFPDDDDAPEGPGQVIVTGSEGEDVVRQHVAFRAAADPVFAEHAAHWEPAPEPAFRSALEDGELWCGPYWLDPRGVFRGPEGDFWAHWPGGEPEDGEWCFAFRPDGSVDGPGLASVISPGGRLAEELRVDGPSAAGELFERYRQHW